MKFTLIKDLAQDRNMKPIMVSLLIFMLLYLIADIFVKNSSLGLMPQDILYTLFGNEEEFLDPMTPSVFLEFIHAEIFFTMMLLLTLSALYGRVSKKPLLINSIMFFSLVSLITLFLSFYFSSYFINIYLFSFFLWHAIAFYMIFYSLWKLNAPSI